MDDRLPSSASSAPPAPGAPKPTPGALREFVAQQPYLFMDSKGLLVLLEKMAEVKPFRDFVNHVFQMGHYFRGISYKNLMAVYYRFGSARAQFPRLRLADGIAPLPQRREMLYQGELLLSPEQAEYDFTMQTDTRATFAQGVKPAAVADEAPRTLDEFVAVLWKKGLRFGLDLEAVKQGLATPKNQFLKLVIARAQMPAPGVDARMEPMMALEKDLRPLETPEGDVDLRRYSCVFPQAKMNQAILRKIPATPGVNGRTVLGEPIPNVVEGQDLSLDDLIGSGVAVIFTGKFPTLMATRNGFVSVDPKTGAVSITDEVINHTPVGIQTGSLSIEGDLCVQFGGVGHGYTLEGRNLEIKTGRVEGSVLSNRGNIKIVEGVAGGQVVALAGNITVDGRVMAGSHLEAYDGTVTIKYAENSVIVGRVVVVDKAVNSSIIAEQAVVKESVASGIIAFSAKIGLLGVRSRQAGEGGMETAGTTLVVPIIEPPMRPAIIIRRTIEALMQPMPELEARIEEIGINPDVITYLRALTTYQTAKDEEQARQAQAIFRPLEDRIRPLVDSWRSMKADRQRLLDEQAGLQTELEVWLAKIRRLEEDLQGSMQYAVGAVSDPNSYMKIFQDPRIPDNFSSVAGMDARYRKQFESLCLQIISTLSSGHGKERLLPIRDPFKSTYRELKALISEAENRPSQSLAPSAGDQEGDRRREKRLTLLGKSDFLAYLGDRERATPPGAFVVPVRVDEILEGFITDLSGLGMGIYLDRKQKFSPVFKQDDKVGLVFSIGPLNFEAELIVCNLDETPRLVRLGGYFVNMPPTLQASLYKVKNVLEARLWGKAPPPGAGE